MAVAFNTVVYTDTVHVKPIYFRYFTMVLIIQIKLRSKQIRCKSKYKKVGVLPIWAVNIIEKQVTLYKRNNHVTDNKPIR